MRSKTRPCSSVTIRLPAELIFSSAYLLLICSAVCRGFDAVTGLGTPNVNGLLLAAMSEAPPVVPPYAWVAPPSSEPLSVAEIAGIVAGCILAIAVITGVFMCMRNRCCASRAEGSVVDTSPSKFGYSY